MLKLVLILSFALLLWENFVLLAEAKVWSAHELAVGEWDVELAGGWFFQPSKVFPTKTSFFRETEKLRVRRGIWGTRVECSLSICPDGTFVLAPRKDGKSKTDSSNDVCNSSDGENPRVRQTNLLDLRGEWVVKSNPYCITDRYFDELKLQSYPRVSMAKGSQGLHPVKAGRLQLFCRMGGKFTPAPRIGRKGRMSHGTLVWRDEKRRNHFPRRIVASFSAKRASNEPRERSWEDEEFFGY